MKRLSSIRASHVLLVLASTLAATLAVGQVQPDAKRVLLERAKSFELDTKYQPPPGDSLTHHASGYAKIMCSSVFITGLDPAFAAENVGYFTAPYAERKKLGTPKIDREKRTVEVTLPDGTVRVARQVGSQGCVTLPIGATDVYFKPSIVKSRLPDPKTQPWPMGDVIAKPDLPSEVDQTKIAQAIEAAFDPAGMTAAYVVTYKGQIIAERYGEGITANTPLESWSMGKSVSGTLMGILVQQGTYDLWQNAPIPEWQSPGDPRGKIRIADLLRMSSGLRVRAPQDPDYDRNAGYTGHVYLYTGSVDSFKYAASLPLQWPPNTVGRYRNTDPVLTSYLIRLAVEKRGEDYHAFPQRALFDKIGVRTMVIDTDPYGNYLMQGYEQASARDWARLGNLYLQDGVWNGERLLPEGYVQFVGTVAPAWEADKRPIYGGGLFWVNGDGGWPVPKEAFFMDGAGGQLVLIDPSRDLVIVRLGHFKGQNPGFKALSKSMAILMEAIPRREK